MRLAVRACFLYLFLAAPALAFAPPLRPLRLSALHAQEVDLCSVPGVEPFLVAPVLELSGSGEAPSDMLAKPRGLSPALTAAEKVIALYEVGMVSKADMAKYYEALAAAEAAVEAERAALVSGASFPFPSMPLPFQTSQSLSIDAVAVSLLAGAVAAALLNAVTSSDLPEFVQPAAFVLGAAAGAAVTSRDDISASAFRFIGKLILGALSSAASLAGSAFGAAGTAALSAIEEATVKAPARALSRGAADVAGSIAAAPGAAASMLIGGAASLVDGAATGARNAAVTAVTAAVDSTVGAVAAAPRLAMESVVSAAAAAPRAAFESVSRLPAGLAQAAKASGVQQQHGQAGAAAAAAASEAAAAIQQPEQPPPMTLAERREIEELAMVRDKLVLLRASLARFEATKSRLNGGDGSAGPASDLARALELARAPEVRSESPEPTLASVSAATLNDAVDSAPAVEEAAAALTQRNVVNSFGRKQEPAEGKKTTRRKIAADDVLRRARAAVLEA